MQVWQEAPERTRPPPHSQIPLVRVNVVEQVTQVVREEHARQFGMLHITHVLLLFKYLSPEQRQEVSVLLKRGGQLRQIFYVQVRQ